MKRWIASIALCIVLGILGCDNGDGGDGQVRPYWGGELSKITVTESNAGDVLQVVHEGVEMAVFSNSPMIDMPFFLEALDWLGFLSRTLSMSETVEFVYEGSCGGTIRLTAQSSWNDAEGWEDFFFQIAASDYCNETDYGPLTTLGSTEAGGTVNGTIAFKDRSESTGTTYNAATTYEVVAYSETYPTAEPEVEEQYLIDGRIMDAFSTSGMMREAAAITPEADPAITYSADWMWRHTLGEEGEGKFYRLTGVWSYDTVAETNGMNVTGTACDYVLGCVDISTESLLDGSGYGYPYYDDLIDTGTLLLTGSAGSKARLTYGIPEPQYILEVWDAGASAWGNPIYFDVYENLWIM